MELYLDNEVYQLYEDYKELGYDNSYYHHLADYLINKLEEQIDATQNKTKHLHC